MNLYVITIEEAFQGPQAPGEIPLQYSKRTVTIPAEDLDAAMILLIDAERGARWRKWWAVIYIYCEPMKSIPNPN